MEKDLGSRRNEVHSRTVNMRSTLKEKGLVEQKVVHLDGAMKSLHFVWMLSLSVTGELMFIHKLA